MVTLPTNLPEFVRLYSARNHRNFVREKRWAVIREVTDAAEARGLDRTACMALLVGVKSCEDWRDASRRRNSLDAYQAWAESRRGWVSFKDTANQREYYTERYLERVQTLFMLGYMDVHGCSRVERRVWVPLAPAFEIIMHITKPKQREYDVQLQLVYLIQKRMRRLKRLTKETLPTRDAVRLLRQVYATFSDEK